MVGIQRDVKGWRGFLACLAVGVALCCAGCSSGEADTSASLVDGASPVDSVISFPLGEYIDIIKVYSVPEEDDDPVLKQAFESRQILLAECMRERGFTY